MILKSRRKLMIALLCASSLLVANQSVGSAQSSDPKGRPYYEERGDIVWEVPTMQKVVALTFDDGPDAKQTPAILDLLQQYHAKATFFVVGKRVAANPDIVRLAFSRGHEIGNHTYNHAYFNKTISLNKFEEEVQQTEDQIQKITGQRTHLFRPPGGYYNAQMIKACMKESYLTILWSWHQDTMDWSSPGKDRIVKKVLGNIRNGDIVLMHDYVKGSNQTIEALKEILPALAKQGYRFITVSELLQYHKQANQLQHPPFKQEL